MLFLSTPNPRHQRNARRTIVVAAASLGERFPQSHALRWRRTAPQDAKGASLLVTATHARPALETHVPRTQRPARRLFRAFLRPIAFESFVSRGQRCSKPDLPKPTKRSQRYRVAIIAMLQQLLVISQHCEARLCSQCRATRANSRCTPANGTTFSGNVFLVSVSASIGWHIQLRRTAARNSIRRTKANQGRTIKVSQAANDNFVDNFLFFHAEPQNLNQNGHEHNFGSSFG